MITPAYSPTATERVLPRLALDFTTGALDSRVTVTRALNTATRVNSSGLIEGVNADLPRFDYDPVTLTCKGLLIEEQRTNLLTYSEQFDNAAWNKNNTTVTANAATGPDGTSSADKLAETATTAVHNAGQSISTTAQAYTFSCYVKAAERNFVLLYHTQSNASISVNLTTGATGTASGTVAPTSSSVTNVGNGWWRVTMTVTATAASNFFGIYVMNGLVNASYAGTAGSGIYVWGAQLEAGAFATSYIPTTTTSLTRNADGVSMTGTNFSSWFNGSAGTFVGQWDSATGAASMLTTAPSSGGSGALLYASAFDAKSYNGTNVAQTTNNYTVNTAFKAGVSYDANGRSVCLNGGTVGTNTGAITAPTSLSLGAGAISGILNGHTYKLFYYPQRLSNAELQAFSK